jgi:hypothetical protein
MKEEEEVCALRSNDEPSCAWHQKVVSVVVGPSGGTEEIEVRVLDGLLARVRGSAPEVGAAGLCGVPSRAC